MNWASVVTTVKDFADIAYTVILIYMAWRMTQVEKNTNSMKDALVAATKAENLLIGHAAGVADQKQAVIDKEAVGAK